MLINKIVNTTLGLAIFIWGVESYAQQDILPAKVSSHGTIFDSPQEVCEAIELYWSQYSLENTGACGEVKISEGCPAWSDLPTVRLIQPEQRVDGACGNGNYSQGYDQDWTPVCDEDYVYDLNAGCLYTDVELEPNTDPAGIPICNQVEDALFEVHKCDTGKECYDKARHSYIDSCQKVELSKRYLCISCTTAITLECATQTPAGFCDYFDPR